MLSSPGQWFDLCCSHILEFFYYFFLSGAVQDPGSGPGCPRWQREHPGPRWDQHHLPVQGARNGLQEDRWADPGGEGAPGVPAVPSALPVPTLFVLSSSHCTPLAAELNSPALFVVENRKFNGNTKFFAVPAAELGPAGAANIQLHAHLQPLCELQELCLQHWGGCRAADEPLRPWPLQIHQVGGFF